ncbi:FAD-dependent oxidoreductase [Streptomyces sp. NPDC057638]|uniref:FAD-dependent oxidoreductase n=1 Tax=Streptomyces sp. NPDC057638 TaxID=3346190 RepID=UPI0036C1292A
MSLDVIVVGGGVSGLATAVVLAERGQRVRVWSAEEAEHTTSAVAGGLWWPYRIEPNNLVGPWSARTLGVYESLAGRPRETGVRLVPGTVVGGTVAELGDWAASVTGLRAAHAGELPPGHTKGVRARVPLVDMPVHLAWLRRRLEAAGGTVERRAVHALAEAAALAPVVVNCTGIGARELADDPGVVPVRGQLVLVENPGLTEWLVLPDDGGSESAYLLPQPGRLVLGGTAEEGDWRREADPATAAAIVERCARAVPEVARARVLGHRVGLRPVRRGGVRIEAERIPGGGLLVHNYGHGGAGVTVAWGCAHATAELVP